MAYGLKLLELQRRSDSVAHRHGAVRGGVASGREPPRSYAGGRWRSGAASGPARSAVDTPYCEDAAAPCGYTPDINASGQRVLISFQVRVASYY